eukprot:10761666-Ditylum_brightwellii.AAC.1
MHNPQPVTKISDHIALHYDMTIKVDHGVSANHPGIVIHGSAKKCASFITITVLIDINVVKAAVKKYKKCWDLEITYKKEIRLGKVHTIPIVVGAL